MHQWELKKQKAVYGPTPGLWNRTLGERHAKSHPNDYRQYGPCKEGMADAPHNSAIMISRLALRVLRGAGLAVMVRDNGGK